MLRLSVKENKEGLGPIRPRSVRFMRTPEYEQVPYIQHASNMGVENCSSQHCAGDIPSRRQVAGEMLSAKESII